MASSGLLDQATIATSTFQIARNLPAERAEQIAMYSPQDIRRRARTKIVATVGPASSDPEKLASLLQAGVDMFRLNMAHGGPDVQQQIVERSAR